MVYSPPARSPVNASRVQTSPAAFTSPRGAAAPGQAVTTLYRRRDGSTGEARHVVPDIAVFAAAFSAFARGTLITTTRGPVAVEDLRPGMKILTNERGPAPLPWIGSVSVDPADIERGPGPLTRIMTGALGLGRPMVDLMIGPGARIAQRGANHSAQVLRPVNDLVDGNSVVAVRPPGIVQLYHIALHWHATISASGLAVETFHPGPGFEKTMTQRQLAEFLALFPHIDRPSDFGHLALARGPLDAGDRYSA